MLIFELSQARRRNASQIPPAAAGPDAIPENLRRISKPLLPEVSELDAVRHYTNLSRRNFSIDTHFYPLGSCTMKYNPRACNSLAMLPQFLARHPDAPAETGVESGAEAKVVHDGQTREHRWLLVNEPEARSA